MPAFAIVLPLIVSAVLLTSGVAKLVRPDSVGEWLAFGIPRGLSKRWLVRVHPWAEIALGVAVAVLGGALGFAAAAASTLLMTAYFVLIWRSLRSPNDVSCACFGVRRRVTRITLLRNAWLVSISAAATSVVAFNPLWGGALLAAEVYWWWVVAATATVLTAAFVLWSDGGEPESRSPSAAGNTPQQADATGRARLRTPAVPVIKADGTTVDLRTLAATRPQLLLAVSSLCDVCHEVVEHVPGWRRRLSEVDLRLLLLFAPDVDRYTQHMEPQSLHDPDGHVRSSIAEWPTPTAVLLGTDGFLSGGPVSGFEQIAEFVDDLSASLGGVSAQDRPPVAAD